MSDKIINVLFLCTGNSARSIIGEALINHWGQGKFRGFSAGSHPKGKVNPLTIELLKHHDFPTDELRSKDWDEFTKADAPKIDIVITVCDNAAAETCPVWPGHPVTAHWGVADPAIVNDDDDAKMEAFHHAFCELENRVKLLVNLPIDSFDAASLQKKLKKIGRTDITEIASDVQF